MPDALELLTRRRSVPVLMLNGGSAPTQNEIDTILTIGARVPDHGKLTPWRFIVFEGDARARAGEIFAKIFAEKNPSATAVQIEAERKRFMHAPLVIAVVSRAAPHVKIPEWEQVMAAGASAMNIVIAANALGYAANWLTGWMAFDRKALDALGIAANEKIAGFIHIGRAAGAVEDRPRPPLADIVTRF
jgi:nitroreductase